MPTNKNKKVSETILNIGILAHVDAGKTTLSEHLLFHTGALRSLGSVDEGTSTTDSLPIEKQRGISVRLATSSFTHSGIKVNLIDTPGHIDFSSEVERSLLALDAAVIVISAIEGIQGHTITLFEAIESLKIPCFIFINKIDRKGTDVNEILQQINSELTLKSLPLQEAINPGNDQVQIKLIYSNNVSLSESIIERIVETDADLLNAYLTGIEPTFEQLDCGLKKAINSLQIIPVLLGSAKYALGISHLVDAIVQYFSAPLASTKKPTTAIVFKIEHDKNLGKMCYLRVFNGEVNPRDTLCDLSAKISSKNKTQKSDKVGQIKTVIKDKYVDKKSIPSGDVGIVSGLSCAKVGTMIGSREAIGTLKHKPYKFISPVMGVQITPVEPSELMNLVKALQELTDEDPNLAMQWMSEIQELHILVTGIIQVEILETVLEHRYSIKAHFSKPSIIYKETPLKTVYGYERYWMPKPCWAIVKLKIEPGQRGSGVCFSSQLSTNKVAMKYQNEVEMALDLALKQGIKGWQVTDCKITLVDGEDHNVHSRSGDFLIATPMAIFNGLIESGTTLLEPVLSFNLTAQLDLLGTITSDITKMRGTFENPNIDLDKFKLQGHLPASTSVDFPIRLASISAGKAKLSTKLVAYEPCSDEQGKIIKYRGISPIEREKWILQARGALK